MGGSSSINFDDIDRQIEEGFNQTINRIKNDSNKITNDAINTIQNDVNKIKNETTKNFNNVKDNLYINFCYDK